MHRTARVTILALSLLLATAQAPPNRDPPPGQARSLSEIFQCICDEFYKRVISFAPGRLDRASAFPHSDPGLDGDAPLAGEKGKMRPAGLG
jgi:hypothetical protein